MRLLGCDPGPLERARLRPVLARLGSGAGKERRDMGDMSSAIQVLGALGAVGRVWPGGRKVHDKSYTVLSYNMLV